MTLHLKKKTWIISTQAKDALCQVWLKMAQWFWGRRFLKSSQCIFNIFSTLRREWQLNLVTQLQEIFLHWSWTSVLYNNYGMMKINSRQIPTGWSIIIRLISLILVSFTFSYISFFYMGENILTKKMSRFKGEQNIKRTLKWNK